MENIFQKNISALMQKNARLANQLANHVPNQAPQFVQENGAYNIVYKNIYIHNRQNPLGEAREIFSRATNEPVSIHLVYGLGLGYLFQLVSVNSLGSVILYEPDLNIMWLSFTLVDFSREILKANVFVTNDLDEVYDAIYKKSGMTNTPQMLSLPSQRNFDPNGFEELVQKLQEIVGSYALDLKYTREKFYPSLKMLIENIPNLMEETPLAEYKDICEGKTAVVVSAGPTLDRNIETLKKYRDRYVLFCVGTALKTIMANGLKPEFLCIIETYNSLKQVEGLDLGDVYFVTEPYANPCLHKYKYKKIFSHISANTPTNHLWAEITGLNIEEYWSKGTVSYTALNCARLLGCSKIVLVGQDLAYIGGQCYSKESAYKDLVCEFNSDKNKWEITAKDFDKFAAALYPSEDYEERKAVALRRLERLNNSLYHVKGIDGSMLPTESVYAAFVTPLSEFALHFNDRRYINTSLVGAQIDGFENLPLEEALSDSLPIGNIELEDKHVYDKELIRRNLEAKQAELKEAIPIIDECLQKAKNIKAEITRTKNADVEVLKLLKKLSLNYITLSSDFANRSKMYDFITAADKIDLDYEMKMMRQFDTESVMRITEKITQYCLNAKDKINEIDNMLNTGIGGI